ncbi:MAG TPA: lamin tail domain-containing protein, partial [Longimicrobiaceae bacterium]|nr:lamin tail domain-containing protein [Longimicrobiaceae bacterium]
MRPKTLRGAWLGALALVLISCSEVGITDPGTPLIAPRFVLTGNAGIVINEIMADPTAVADASGEWFEVFNAGDTPVDLQGWKIASGNDAVHTISASVVVAPGAYAVIARNASSATNGGVTAAYAYSAAPVPNLANNATDWLALRDPANVSIDSVFWGATPPTAASRGVIDPLAVNTLMNGTNWSTQTTVFGAGDRGTPGAVNDGGTPPPPPPPPPATGDVVINEVMANPDAVLDASGEWFEVHNRGSTPVDLQGWVIASGSDAAHTIGSSVVIAAGGYAVFGRNGTVATNGGVAVNYVYASPTPNLGNGSDWLALRSGATVDSVAWTSVPTGSSRSLIDPASDNVNMNGTGWFTSNVEYGDGDRGTPGAVNFTGPPGEPGVPASVFISINNPRQVPVGYTKPAFPTVRDAFNSIVSPPPPLTWSSGDPAVATVDSLGYITGVGEGTTNIRATTPTGVFGEVSFTVIPATAPTSALYRDHVEFGAPVDATPGDEHVLSKPQFVSSWNVNRGSPNWVSWNINATHFGAAPRCDCF